MSVDRFMIFAQQRLVAFAEIDDLLVVGETLGRMGAQTVGWGRFVGRHLVIPLMYRIFKSRRQRGATYSILSTRVHAALSAVKFSFIQSPFSALAGTRTPGTIIVSSSTRPACGLGPSRSKIPLFIITAGLIVGTIWARATHISAAKKTPSANAQDATFSGA